MLKLAITIHSYNFKHHTFSTRSLWFAFVLLTLKDTGGRGTFAKFWRASPPSPGRGVPSRLLDGADKLLPHSFPGSSDPLLTSSPHANLASWCLCWLSVTLPSPYTSLVIMIYAFALFSDWWCGCLWFIYITMIYVYIYFFLIPCSQTSTATVNKDSRA